MCDQRNVSGSATGLSIKQRTQASLAGSVPRMAIARSRRIGTESPSAMRRPIGLAALALVPTSITRVYSQHPSP